MLLRILAVLRRKSLFAILMLMACLVPRPRLAAAQPTAPPLPATNPATAKVSSATNAPVVPKPLPGRLALYPTAFRKAAPETLGDLRSMENYVKSLVARVSPAVVAVSVGMAGGSGVVISSDGLVLSAAHVCGTPNREVEFTFPDGKTAHGKTLGTNHELDAGLMKITDPGPWPHVPAGELEGARLGDWVLALGHPGGFDPQRPTVARLGRIIVLTPRLVQSDCTLLGGDSGGPLFDLSGRVIGIHSRISESTEENFHVPISAFLDSWDRLARGDDWGYGEFPARAYIGIWGVDATDGFLLQSVDADSPASRAGLKAGDIVTRFNNQAITSVTSYQQVLARTRPGNEVTLRIKRDGKELTLRVTVGSRGRGGGRGRFGRP